MQKGNDIDGEAAEDSFGLRELLAEGTAAERSSEGAERPRRQRPLNR